MIQDGWGYGKSNCWRYQAKNIAHQLNEECKHIDTPAFDVKITWVDNQNTKYVGFKVKCVTCGSKFYETRKRLTNKFLEFYQT